MSPEAVPENPQYEHPPVVELALSVQFKPLARLSVSHLGLLWNRYRADYPKAEHHPPLNRSIETFEESALLLKRISLEIATSLPVPRVWFLAEDGSELLQVQQDRFVQNWRKRGDKRYPSYTDLRTTFREKLDQFTEFVSDEELGVVDIEQCEITYVDHVEVGEGDGVPNTLGDLGQVFAFWDPSYTVAGLGPPEQSRCNLRFVIRDEDGAPLGRVHLNAQPTASRINGKRIFEVQTTGRGRPLGEGADGALSFLDRAHTAVVSLFQSVMRPELKQAWGIKP